MDGNILFGQFPIDRTEEQLGKGVVNGIVVNIQSVHKGGKQAAVGDGLVVTADDFRDGNIVSARHDAAGNTRGIDLRAIGTDKKQPNEITFLLCMFHERNLVGGGQYRFENQTAFVGDALFPCLGGITDGLHHGIRRVPVSEHIARNVIRVDVFATVDPLMFQYLFRYGRFSRTVRARDNEQFRLFHCG